MKFCTIDEKPGAGMVTTDRAAELTGVAEDRIRLALTPTVQARGFKTGGFRFRAAAAPADRGPTIGTSRPRFPSDETMPINAGLHQPNEPKPRVPREAI